MIAQTASLPLSQLPVGTHRLRLTLAEDGLGRAISVPVIILRGASEGLTAGITAALHGNELNGILVIHRVLRTIDPTSLVGNIIAVPVLNIPGYHSNRREFSDGRDLNQFFPGRLDGNASESWAAAIMERLICHLDVLFDLHTASYGRVNTYYVRADMGDPRADRLARSLCPQIILNSRGDGTMRAAAQARGVCAVTVELGDPQILQVEMIRDGRISLCDALEGLGMVEADHETATNSPVLCSRSSWLYTDTGGILRVLPRLTQQVSAGELIAEVRDEWGDLLRTYHAPTAGIVIGHATNPVAPTGSRIIHLGILA